MATDYTYTILQLAPGVDRNSTQLGAEPTWYDVDKVRFRHGRAQRMFGWQQAIDIPQDKLDGVTRDMHTWADLNGRAHLGIGTNKKLYINRGGLAYDVTPIVTVVTVSSGVDMAALGTLISVSVSDLGWANGYWVNLSSENTVGGTNYFDQKTGPQSAFEISNVSTDGFTFNAPTSAVSTSAGTGKLELNLLVPPGDLNAVIGTGWGVSTWGTGAWGTSRDDNIARFGSYWVLDNWGQDLLAIKAGGIERDGWGRLYHWEASAGLSTRAVLITASPSTANYMIVTDERFVVLFGTQTSVGANDASPMRVRWCDTENFNDWVASIGNQAGDFILTGGSRIVTAVKTRGEVLILTDDSAWVMRYIGQPFVYSFDQVGALCGCVGPHAAIEVHGVVYWMSEHGFFMYDGTVRPLHSPVHRYVYDAQEPGYISFEQRWKTYAGSNIKFDEILWFYQGEDTTSGDCNRYVAFNFKDNLWYYGTMDRTAWVDRGVWKNPLGAAVSATTTVSLDTGDIFYQDIETSNAGIAPYNAYLESGSFDFGEGDQMVFINRIIPDFDIDSGDLLMYVKSRKYPGDDWTVKGPFSISTGTRLINPRVRGRNFALRFDSSTSSNWTMGNMRFAITPDGDQ